MPAGNNILIRPPVLLDANQSAQNSASAPPPAPLPESHTAAITELVTRLVGDTLRREGREIINSLLNATIDNGIETDQAINQNQAADLSDMDKIPDVVKSLREFSGQPGEFSSWRKSVERILNIYEPIRGTPKYYGMLSVIRNKIIGQADTVLESYNIPLNWKSISKCLTLHYADKRDLGTLEYQMTTLVQGNRSIHEFYQAVYHHLSLILNKLSSMEMSPESMGNLIRTYRDKALDTFIRGLKGDLPRLLSIKEPVDLPQALHLCLKLQNVDFRVQYAHHNHSASYRHNSQAPPIPPKRNLHQALQIPRRPFYPELYHDPVRAPPQPFQTQNYHRQHQNNQKPLPPKPWQRSEPMDIDHSIHSRAVNYQNRPRPQPNVPKRPPPQNSQQVHVPNKYQRIFNTEQQDNIQCNNEINEYANQIEQEDINYDEPLADYAENQDNPYDPLETVDNINFLD